MNDHFIKKAAIVEGGSGTYVSIKLYSVKTGVTTHTSIQVSSADLLKNHFKVLKVSQLSDKEYQGKSSDSHTALH